MRRNRITMAVLQHILLPLLSVFTLLIVDATSILSYFYSLLLFFLFNRIITGKWIDRNFAYLHYYIFVAIFLFVCHNNMIPMSLGSTGGVEGLGTDDYNFYTRLITHDEDRYNYTLFLRYVYPFEIKTLLNMVILNLLGIVFLPHFVNRISYLYSGSESLSLKAEKIFLLCPFTTYYGCILMRDMWIATFVFAGLYYFFRRRYLPLAFCIALIVFIRFGSIVFLGAGILVMMRERIYTHFSSRMKGRIAILTILGVVMMLFGVAFPYLQEFSGGKLEEGLFRASFYMKLESMDPDAFILHLMDLPFPLNLLSLIVFFFFLPFLSLTFYTFGIFNMGHLFCSFLTPTFFFFLWDNVINTVLQSLLFKINNSINTIVYMAILFAMCLGTVSLQARHKTILFPLLCIIAAYGICNTNKRYSKFSYLLAATCVLIQLYMAL